MSLLDKNIGRRSFLRVTAGAAAAAAAFGIAGTDQAHADASSEAYDKVASDAQVTGGKGEWIPIHCHQNCSQMCENLGYVVDGVVVRQKTDDTREDSFDCPQQRGCLRGRSCASRCTTVTV